MKNSYTPKAVNATQINSINIANASSEDWVMLMSYIRYIVYFGVTSNTYSMKEITSRCIEKSFRSKGSFNPALGKLSTWLQKIIKTCTSDYFNDQRNRVTDAVNLKDVMEFFERNQKFEADSFDCNEAISLLYKFADKQTGQKKVLALMMLQDSDNQEIADKLCLTKSVVEVRKARLKTEMMDFLKLNGVDYLPLTA